MHNYPGDQLHQLRPFFKGEFPNKTILLSCIAGHSAGEGFVDSTAPVACMIVHGFHNLTFIGGAPEQDWLNQACDLLRDSSDVQLLWPPGAEGDLEPPPGPTHVTERYEFSDLPLPEDSSADGVSLPTDLALRRMDRELLKGCLWADEMKLAYGSVEKFLQHGFGYCLMRGEEICCEAYASFLAQGCYELGVITPEQHRGQGYASLTCAHLIRVCAEQGYATRWSCNQGNLASTATARRLGYRTQQEYQLLYYAQRV